MTASRAGVPVIPTAASRLWWRRTGSRRVATVRSAWRARARGRVRLPAIAKSCATFPRLLTRNVTSVANGPTESQIPKSDNVTDTVAEEPASRGAASTANDGTRYGAQHTRR